MTRITSPVAGGDTGSIDQYNNLRREAEASSRLLASAQAVPNLTLRVSEGAVFFGDTRIDYAGGNTASFADPASTNRIDCLSLSPAGALVITQGVEGSSPAEPTCPIDNLSICFVYNKHGQTSIKNTSDGTNGYIYKDIRQGFWKQNPFTGYTLAVYKNNIDKVFESNPVAGDYFYAPEGSVTDGTYLYVIGYNAIIRKYDLATLTLQLSSASTGASSQQCQLVIIGAYIYVASVNVIKKYDLATLTYQASSSVVPTGIQALATDGTYIYATSTVTPFHIWKFNTSLVKQTESNVIETGAITHMVVAGAYIFATIGTKVTKYLLSTLVYQSVTTTLYGGTISCIATDGTYIYIGGATTYQVWKFDCATLTFQLASTVGNTAITGLAVSGAYIYSCTGAIVRKFDIATLVRLTESSGVVATGGKYITVVAPYIYGNNDASQSINKLLDGYIPYLTKN